MKPKEIRELAPAELDKKLRDTRDKLLRLHINKNTGQVEKTHEITALRKDVARFETIRNEKLGAETQSA